MKDKPLISVIMPLHNAEQFVEDAIKSVIAQSHFNFEFIIVDDHSTDNSPLICSRYKKIDKRIKFFKNDKEKGVGNAINKAISVSKGDYIARMDADDIMVFDRLEKQVNFLEKNKEIICLGSYMKEIDENNQIIGKRTVSTNHSQIYEKMFYTMGIQSPALMINRDLVPKNFSWCKNYGILDDLDLLFKLINFGKFANLNEYLMLYRIHKNNLSLKNIKKTFKEALMIRKDAVKKYHYKPTIKSKMIMHIQTIVVNLLPEKFLYNLYKLFSKYEKLFE